MNRLLTVATIAIMLVSCVKVEVVEPEVAQTEMNAIEFGAFVDKSSRGVETTSSTLDKAKVYAFYSGIDEWSTSTSPVQYMDAELSIDAESNTITCSPTSYWPGMVEDTEEYGKLSFFSYAPVVDECALRLDSKTIKLDYTVYADPSMQHDLVFAAEYDRTQGDVTPSVSLEYNHILSKISISAKSSSTNTKVKSVQISYNTDQDKHILCKGTYVHDAALFDRYWIVDTRASFTGTTDDLSPDTDITLTTEPQEIMSSDNYLMLMPQYNIKDGSLSVIVTYNAGGEDIEKTCELPAPTGGKYEIGVHYNYTLEVDNSYIVINEIVINPWDAMEEVHPFNIYTAEQLASIGHDPLYVNNGCYMIMNDIDVSDYINRRSNGSWKPLCGDDPFTGEIVGQGFTITGMTINDPAGTNQGLFAKVDGANIHDLNIGAPNITGGTNVGGLAGNITNSTTIKDCSTVGGTISGSSTVGGLAGVTGGATISYGHNSAIVSAKVDNAKSGIAGGIVGKGDGSTVIACYNRGEISGVKSIGGIAGELTSSKLVTCYNTAAVTGFDTAGATVTRIADTRYFAGIAGSSKSSELIGCYNTGRIKWARYGDVASGIVGQNGGGNTLTACHHLIGSAKREIETSKTAHSDADFRLLDELNALVPAMNEAASDKGYGGYSSYSSTTYLPSVEPDVRITMSDYVEANYQPIFDHYDLFKNVNMSLNYQVMNDIYGFKDVPTIPLGQSSSAPFRGAFNGDNYTLFELSMVKTWGIGASLFGYVNSSSTRAIENYKLSAPNIEGKDDSSSKRIGGFVGELYSGDIRNCHIVDGGRVYSHVNTCGGIVGYCHNANSSIVSCSNTANVKADNFAGGIVGVASQFKVISECSNSANIHTTDNSCGGIVGEAHDEASTKWDGIILNCTNSGSIDSADGSKVGGIVGSCYSTDISGCVNRGVRVYAAGSYAGGILGNDETLLGNKPGTIINCGNHGYVRAADNYVGGIVGCYNYDNFNYDSDMNSNDTIYDFATVVGYIKGCYCSPTSKIEAGDDYVGGIVGRISAARIQGCHNNGSVRSENKDNFLKDYSGGIAGDCDQAYIHCCYNSGTVFNTMKDWSISGGIIARGDPAYLYGCYNSGKVSDGNTGWLYDYDGAVCGRNGGSETACYYVKGVHSDGDGGSPVDNLAGLNSKIATMNSKDASPYWFVQGSGNNLPYIMGPDGMVGEQAPYVKY